jgi:hypothetical protein
LESRHAHQRLEILARGAIPLEFHPEWHGHCNDIFRRTKPNARRLTMTATTTQTTNKTQTPLTRDEVKQMLRDAAFVLKMTQRVRDEMEAERPEAVRQRTNPRPELAAGLGV